MRSIPDYRDRTDDELLHLFIHSRTQLTPEACLALDAEIRNRNLHPEEKTLRRRDFDEAERTERKQRAILRHERKPKHLSWAPSRSNALPLLLVPIAIILLIAVLLVPKQYEDKFGWPSFMTIYYVCGAILLWPKAFFSRNRTAARNWITLLCASFGAWFSAIAVNTTGIVVRGSGAHPYSDVIFLRGSSPDIPLDTLLSPVFLAATYAMLWYGSRIFIRYVSGHGS